MTKINSETQNRSGTQLLCDERLKNDQTFSCKIRISEKLGAYQKLKRTSSISTLAEAGQVMGLPTQVAGSVAEAQTQTD